jgi:hypothetical protein
VVSITQILRIYVHHNPRQNLAAARNAGTGPSRASHTVRIRVPRCHEKLLSVFLRHIANSVFLFLHNRIPSGLNQADMLVTPGGASK